MKREPFSGAAAVVTGHSRGLGAAIALHLLQKGVRVLGIARRSNSELAARYADLLIETRLDLADSSSLLGWLQKEELARFFLDANTALLVNNAGTLQPVAPLEEQDVAIITSAVALNVGAALALSAAFVQATASAQDRRILHISSGAASSPYAGWSIYCATKAALDQHARAVALDNTPRLRVGSVAPGVINTEMQAEIRATPEEHFPDRERFVQMHKRAQLISPGRAGAAVVEFLLSEPFGEEPVTDLYGRY